MLRQRADDIFRYYFFILWGLSHLSVAHRPLIPLWEKRIVILLFTKVVIFAIPQRILTFVLLISIIRPALNLRLGRDARFSYTPINWTEEAFVVPSSPHPSYYSTRDARFSISRLTCMSLSIPYMLLIKPVTISSFSIRCHSLPLPPSKSSFDSLSSYEESIDSCDRNSTNISSIELHD